jgi:hypothetical protein
MKANCQNLSDRLIVTPKLANQLSTPDGLRVIANGAARQDAHGAGPGRNWDGAAPVIAVWPQERIVQRCIDLAHRQTLILLEQAVTSDATSFQGWACAVGAFNAETGRNEQPDPALAALLDNIITGFENELAGPPSGPGAEFLHERIRELPTGPDEDFIVTYTLALGYTGDITRFRQHYRSAWG